MPSATLTSKGQITIPKKIRDELNLKAGDVLNFELGSRNKVVIATNKKHYSEAFGMLYREGQEAKSDSEINEGIEEYLIKKYKKL